MGCDIYTYAERKTENGYEFIEDFRSFAWRYYGMFGFLAGVRNYSDVTPIVDPRGLPNDISTSVEDKLKWSEAYSSSWLSVKELVEFDYEATMEDRRVTLQTGPNSWDGGQTSKPGGGKTKTYREFLGQAFLDDIQTLQEIDADRVIFWFD